MNFESRGLSEAGYDYDYDYDTNTNSKDIKKVVIGALAGAAIGSLVAGAFTQKGVRVRNRVSAGTRNMAGNLKHKVSDVKEAIADKFEAAKEGAADLIEKGKRKVGLSKQKETYLVNSAYTGAEEEEGTGTGKKLLIGTIILSVAGAVVWSFATDKGKQTRKRVVAGSKDLAGTLKNKASHIKNIIADTYHTAKEGAAELLEKEQQKGTISSGDTFNSTGNSNWQG